MEVPVHRLSIGPPPQSQERQVLGSIKNLAFCSIAGTSILCDSATCSIPLSAKPTDRGFASTRSGRLPFRTPGPGTLHNTPQPPRFYPSSVEVLCELCQILSRTKSAFDFCHRSRFSTDGAVLEEDFPRGSTPTTRHDGRNREMESCGRRYCGAPLLLCILIGIL